MAGLPQTSIVKLRDVLLVTLPADAGDEEIATLQDLLLEAMGRHEPRGVVLDMATVTIFDSFLARVVTESARMIALMGGRTVISGMRAPVAITITQLGLELNNVATALDVDQAFSMLSGAAL